MKKIYKNPEMEIVKMATQQMLAGSNPEEGFTSGGKGDLGNGVSSGNLGRDDDFDW